ncbi:MATE family efflux transporter [Shewanella algae]
MNIKKVFGGSAINLAYQLIPALSALFMVPLTIKWYGTERFSIFSLAVSVIVLFNYLNFGVAQSTSRDLSKAYGGQDESKINEIISSGFVAITAIGFFTSIIGFFYSDRIASMLTDSESGLYQETRVLMETVLLWAPLFLLIIFFRSVLESKLLFKYTSLNRALLNTFIFISPAFCYWCDFGIAYSIYFIIIVHMISMIILLMLILKSFNGLKFSFSKELCTRALISGGWLTIISLSSIGFLYADKFIIGSVLGLAILAYYVAAYDLISRASILYGSISAAFFPAFSYWFEKKDIQSLQDSMKYLLIIMSTIMSIALSFVILFSQEILYYWIDGEFSDYSSQLLKILSVGVLFSSLSIIYMRLLCAVGKEKVVALFYLAQSLIYVPISFLVAKNYGNEGVAWLFSIRCLTELLVLSKMSAGILEGLNTLSKQNASFFILTLLFIVLSFFLSYSTLQVKAIAMFLIMSSGIAMLYFEKDNFKNILKIPLR